MDMLKVPGYSERGQVWSLQFNSVNELCIKLTVKECKFSFKCVATLYTQYGEFQPDFDASSVPVHILEDSESDSDLS